MIDMRLSVGGIIVPIFIMLMTYISLFNFLFYIFYLGRSPLKQRQRIQVDHCCRYGQQRGVEAVEHATMPRQDVS